MANKNRKEKNKKIRIIFSVLPQLVTINMICFYNEKRTINKLKLKTTHTCA